MKNIIVSNINWAIWNKKTQEIEVYISTADLIAELEKRRPCEKCENYGGRRTECINCLGAYIHYMRTATDNYKEANHG